VFIDIHTHNLNKEPDITKVSVIEFSALEVFDQSFVARKYSCVGIHPWQVEQFHIEDKLLEFRKFLNLNSPWAIGEIGLDKKYAADFEKQITVFKEQLQLAKDFNIPRIIVHMVAASNDTIRLLKESKYQGKVLFHDYNMNELIAKDLIANFDCYFSFGKKILNPKTKAFKVLLKIPKERIFLETDDNAEVSIMDLYTEFSKTMNLPKGETEKLFSSNFNTFNS
jgi:TatD DNase family protein